MILTYLWLLAVPGLSHGADIPPHLQEDAHKIVKRFADQHEFEGHDIADVLFEKHTDTLRHINRRDLSSVVNSQHERDFTSLRLNMKNTQDSLRLKLKKRAIVDDKTEFVTHTKQGRVKRSSSVMGDCFATGHEEESPNEIAAVSMCDGLHGVVSRRGVDYYIHPVEREAADEGHQVHVLWKRSVVDETFDDDYVDDEDLVDVESGTAASSGAWKTETEFTIEFALFTDAAGWKEVHKLAPGREDEYMLVAMAGANALYGDRDKVGYDVFFKVKLIEIWEDNPEEYDFQQNTLHNLGSFCGYTRKLYANPPYDMHLLHTGIAHDGNVAGRGFLSGVCGSQRCVDVREFYPNRFQLIAHEIGHNLGFRHHVKAKCPEDIKNLGGSFMGGNYYEFSPCNRWELQKLFKEGGGKCLFQEIVKDPIRFDADLPRVFPGQSRSPDKLCELYAGFGFKYFRPYDLTGNGACRMFLCINADRKCPAYESIKWMTNFRGFPCDDEKFCMGECHPWTGGDDIGWNVDYLKTLKRQHEWSSWSEEWSGCSSTCGTGVQIKERTCLIGEGPNVSPYCKGSDNVKARLCSQKPCEGEQVTANELRKLRGDKMCANFNNHGVQLLDNEKYLNVSKEMIHRKYYFSTSCLLSCQRSDRTSANIDGLLPGGTPCLETTRGSYDHQRFNIEMKCVKGKCLEFSDCRDNERKDDCGVCTNIDGYNGSRCVRETVNIGDPGLKSGDSAFLTTIPTGSSRISVEANHPSNGRLEIWTEDEPKMIWGQRRGGQLSHLNYLEGNEVEYAGAQWTLHYKRYIRCEGSISESVVLKWRVGLNPSKQIIVSYLLS